MYYFTPMTGISSPIEITGCVSDGEAQPVAIRNLEKLLQLCVKRKTAQLWCVTMAPGSVRRALLVMMLPGLFSHPSWDVPDTRE